MTYTPPKCIFGVNVKQEPVERFLGFYDIKRHQLDGHIGRVNDVYYWRSTVNNLCNNLLRNSCWV